jgi:hypothetical protein
MRILITENKIEKVKTLIDKMGVKKVISLIGGSDNFIKILGPDGINEYVYKYLDENCYPDYGWESPDYYKEQIERFGDLVFHVNDRLTFDYTEYENGYKKLDVYPWLYNEMEELFSINDDDTGWVKLIVNWFETNTGLKVDGVV